MYKGYDRLTVVERRHLKIDAGVKTTQDLEVTFRDQAQMRAKHPKSSDPCWECRRIAKKLGYPITVEPEGARA